MLKFFNWQISFMLLFIEFWCIRKRRINIRESEWFILLNGIFVFHKTVLNHFTLFIFLWNFPIRLYKSSMIFMNLCIKSFILIKCFSIMISSNTDIFSYTLFTRIYACCVIKDICISKAWNESKAWVRWMVCLKGQRLRR